MQFSVNKYIFNVLIGEMLFEPIRDGEVASSQEFVLAAFVELAAADKIQDSDEELQTDYYSINIFQSCSVQPHS